MTHAPQNPNESEAASESTPKHVDLADADISDDVLEGVAGGLPSFVRPALCGLDSP
jgi:hypothetical protein